MTKLDLETRRKPREMGATAPLEAVSRDIAEERQSLADLIDSLHLRLRPHRQAAAPAPPAGRGGNGGEGGPTQTQ